MLQQLTTSTLVVIHKDKQEQNHNQLCINDSINKLTGSAHSDFAKWETCVREIAFAITFNGSLNTPSSPLTALTGKQAYEFILEVICGLHSPLLGETEVFGQFKEFFDRHWKNSPQSPLSKVFFELNRHAKEIRRMALQNLGHQSYPGLLRKKLKSFDSVHLFGGGQLSLELVQWLNKSDKDIHVYIRDTNKISAIKNRFPSVDVWNLNDHPQITNGALIIAAPSSANQLTEWISDKPFTEIYDLRGESKSDPLVHVAIKASLHELFAEIESAKHSLKEKVSEAKELIKIKSQEAVKTFSWTH